MGCSVSSPLVKHLSYAFADPLRPAIGLGVVGAAQDVLDAQLDQLGGEVLFEAWASV